MTEGGAAPIRGGPDTFARFELRYGAAILHQHAPVSLGGPGVLRTVIGTGPYLAVLSLFALAIGALLRHTAAAITGVIGFVLVLSPLAQLLPGSLGKDVHAYLPSEAGQLIAKPTEAQPTCCHSGKASGCSAGGPHYYSPPRSTSSSAETRKALHPSRPSKAQLISRSRSRPQPASPTPATATELWNRSRKTTRMSR